MIRLFLMITAFVALGLALSTTARADGPTDELVPWPKLVTNVPKGTVNACQGITFAYSERVEAQGFLGLATPSAHIENVQNAVEYNTFVAWKSYEMRQSFGAGGDGKWSYQEYQEKVPHELRPKGGSLGVMAFEFRLSQLCSIAKARGMKRLTFACDADKVSSENSKGETTSERLVAECFISSYQGTKPSWKDLSGTRMGTSFSNKETYEGGDVSLDSSMGRTLAYYPLIKWAVDSIVGQDEQRKRNAAARASQDIASCPQPQSLPISPSAFPIAVK